MPADLPRPVSTASAAHAGRTGRGAAGVHSERASAGRFTHRPMYQQALLLQYFAEISTAAERFFDPV